MILWDWLKQEFIHNSAMALRRFPLTLAYSAVTVALIIYAVEMHHSEMDIYRFVLTASLGVPLSFAVSIYAERQELKTIARVLSHAIIGCILISFCIFFLPQKPYLAAIIRFALVAALVHVWVAFAAYPRDSSQNAFWQFNRSLFLRFAVASLFSGILYLGLTIALVSIDALIGIKIEGKRYSELFFVCAGIIHPWFFLAGIPRNLDTEVDVYPPALRIFTQYILIPLVALYLLILYVYSAKVIFQWEWPRYKATYLVGLFSAPGILAALLLFPLSASEWVKKYTKILFVSLIPLVLMMLICVYRRVIEHGVTEMMVIAIAMGIWLLFIATYTLATRGNNMRAIPVSLALFLLAISFGPLSAPSLGQSSQTTRLKAILVTAGLPEGRITPSATKKIRLPYLAYSEMVNKSRYLTDHFGAEGLLPFIQGDRDVLLLRTGGDSKERRTGYEAHNFFINHFENTEPAKQSYHGYRTYAIKNTVLNIKGFRRLIHRQIYRSDKPSEFLVENYRITVNWQTGIFSVKHNESTGQVNFSTLYETLQHEHSEKESPLPQTSLTRNFRLGQQKARIVFMHISGEKDVREIEFNLLLP